MVLSVVNDQIVLFDTDETLASTTTVGQSGPGSNGYSPKL